MKPDTLVWLSAGEYGSVQNIWNDQFIWCPLAVDKSLPLNQASFIHIDRKRDRQSARAKTGMASTINTTMLESNSDTLRAATGYPTTSDCLGIERPKIFPALGWLVYRRTHKRQKRRKAANPPETQVLFPASEQQVFRRRKSRTKTKNPETPSKRGTNPPRSDSEHTIRPDPEFSLHPDPERSLQPSPEHSPQPQERRQLSTRAASRTSTARGRSTHSDRGAPARRVSPSTERALDQARRRREAIEALRPTRSDGATVDDATAATMTTTTRMTRPTAVRTRRPAKLNGLHSFHLLRDDRAAAAASARSAPPALEMIPHSPSSSPPPANASAGAGAGAGAGPAGGGTATAISEPPQLLPLGEAPPPEPSRARPLLPSSIRPLPSSRSACSAQSLAPSASPVSAGFRDDQIDRWRSVIPPFAVVGDIHQVHPGAASAIST